MISENNRKENWMTRYYDIHMIIDDNDDCKEGYSIFVSASSEHEAIQFIIDNQLYEDKLCLRLSLSAEHYINFLVILFLKLHAFINVYY